MRFQLFIRGSIDLSGIRVQFLAIGLSTQLHLSIHPSKESPGRPVFSDLTTVSDIATDVYADGSAGSAKEIGSLTGQIPRSLPRYVRDTLTARSAGHSFSGKGGSGGGSSGSGLASGSSGSSLESVYLDELSDFLYYRLSGEDFSSVGSSLLQGNGENKWSDSGSSGNAGLYGFLHVGLDWEWLKNDGECFSTSSQGAGATSSQGPSKCHALIQAKPGYYFERLHVRQTLRSTPFAASKPIGTLYGGGSSGSGNPEQDNSGRTLLLPECSADTGWTFPVTFLDSGMLLPQLHRAQAVGPMSSDLNAASVADGVNSELVSQTILVHQIYCPPLVPGFDLGIVASHSHSHRPNSGNLLGGAIGHALPKDMTPSSAGYDTPTVLTNSGGVGLANIRGLPRGILSGSPSVGSVDTPFEFAASGSGPTYSVGFDGRGGGLFGNVTITWRF